MHKRKSKIAKIVILSIALFLIASNIASAAPSWWPIVPCGLSKPGPTDPGQPDHDYTQPCNPCELFHMGRNIIDFVLRGMMPPVAAGLFIWGGFLILMGGPNPALFAKGKQIFTTTFYGVLVILASWLITNTILMSVAQDSIEITKSDGTKETVNIVTDWNKFTCEYTGTAPIEPESGTLTILPDSLPDAVANITNYNQQFSVAPNSTGISPYKWSQSGSLPPGLSFNASSAILTGTPTQDGSFTFTVKVEDSSTVEKSSGTKTYTINVGGLVIKNNSLPDAVVGTYYTAGLLVEGGTRPHKWSIDGSSLSGVAPNEFAIGETDGEISARPTQDGSFTFTVKVEDSSSPKLSATKTFTLKISSSADNACTLCPAYNPDATCGGQKPQCSGSYVDTGQPLNGGNTCSYATQSVADRLVKLRQLNNGWVLSEGFPPTISHSDTSHCNGTTVDIASRPAPGDNAEGGALIDKLCRDAQTAGFTTIQNEYTNIKPEYFSVCGKPRSYTHTNGPHLHLE